MRRRGLFLSGVAALLLMALVIPAWGDDTVEVVPGNPHCVQPEGIGSTAEFQFKVENPRGTNTYHAPDGGQFTVEMSGNRRDITSVVSNRSISEIIVKGGPVGANVYSYSPAVASASGLTAPGPHMINHIVFCYDDGVSLSGMKFGDANFNGTKDASEAGLAGWTINVYDAEGFVASTTTGTGGSYSFSLPPGHYLVCEAEAPSGWAQTAPANTDCADIADVEEGGHAVDLTASSSSGNDFGNAETETLACEGAAQEVSADPQYTLILRGCEGSKEFFFSAGFDVNGNPFVNLMPLPGQDEAHFLEELIFSADPEVTQASKLVYDDHVGAGERDMLYCQSDPRVNGEFELVSDPDPGEILPTGHTSCIIRAEFQVVAGGVQVTFIIYSNTDGGRTFL